MAHRVPQILGYHGNELRYYDELLGGKGRWEHLAQGNPTILDLTAVRYIILAQEQELPGFHKVVGPVPTSGTGATGILYERDTVPSYARVLPAAVRAPEAQVAPTVVDPRFPYERVVIYADSASVLPEPIPANALPAPAATRARVAAWAPGAIRIALEGRDPKPAYLMVSENWYPDWRATVDGRPTPVHRADNTFLSVVLPPGAKEVRFEFHDPTYGTGKAITIVALLLTLGLLATGLLAGRVPGRRKEGEAKA
jgi:hypothetical protein